MLQIYPDCEEVLSPISSSSDWQNHRAQRGHPGGTGRGVNDLCILEKASHLIFNELMQLNVQRSASRVHFYKLASGYTKLSASVNVSIYSSKLDLRTFHNNHECLTGFINPRPIFYIPQRRLLISEWQYLNLNYIFLFIFP